MSSADRGQDASRRPFETALIALFFVSGATSLVYETLWARQLHLVFGTSQLAISTVLAAFMGGLAAGGFAAARWAGRVRNPIAVYAWLELFIGAYALVFPTLQSRAHSVFLTGIQSGDLGQLPRAALQLVVAGLLLLPPTLCMGATLPLLARIARTSTTSTGPTVGRLYGVNTLGAVTGTALAGFVLLPVLGLAVTTRWTAAANAAIALAAALAARSWRPPPEAAAPARAAWRARTRIPALLLLMAAATGFTGLLYEVAWFRLMSLLLGGSAYAFSIMLLAFLLGIGLGGLIGGSAIDRRTRAGGGSQALLRDLAMVEIGIGLLSWGAMFVYGQLPFLWVRLYGVVEGSWLLIWASQLLIALAVMTPPAVLMGVSFPYLAHLAGPRTEETDRAVGLIYGANTLGAIVGAVVGALFVLPVLHVRGAILVGASMNVAIALLAAIGSIAPGPRWRRRVAAATAVALSAIALSWWKPPPWDPMLMTAGVYQYVRKLRSSSEGKELRLVDPNDEMLFYDEGLTSVVTVARDRVDNNIWLANNGKTDASSQGDLKTQVLLGQLGFAFRPEARQVMVVGLASGITAGSVTLRPAPRAIDVVEIEPVIVEASRQFNEYNHRPLDDPRVRLVLDDARSHLLRVPDGHYDLVISEPSNPWLSGVSNLFTREFFELGKSKLSPDGVWVQWLHCYEMSADDLRSLLATFAAVYPEVQVFRVDSADLVVLGSRASLDLSVETIRSSLSSSAASAIELRDLGMGEPEDLLAHHLFGRDRLVQLAGSVELNTDDNMRIEYSAPLHLYEDTSVSNDRLLLEHAELPVLAVEGVLGLFALANSYTNIGLDDRAEAAKAAAHQLAATPAEGTP